MRSTQDVHAFLGLSAADINDFRGIRGHEEAGLPEIGSFPSHAVPVRAQFLARDKLDLVTHLGEPADEGRYVGA